MNTSNEDRTMPRKRGAVVQEDTEHRNAERERSEPTVSKPGGFQNDPDDATNPNEVREKHLKKLRR